MGKHHHAHKHNRDHTSSHEHEENKTVYRQVLISPSEEEDQEDEIDLGELFALFWDDRILIAKIVGVFLVFGIFIALFSSVEYQTQSVLMPEVQSSQSKASSLLNKYGGLLGISGGGLQSKNSSSIPPSLYPQIVKSIPFQLKLMNTPLRFQQYDTTATAKNFFQHIYRPSLFSYIKQYTIGLPGMVAGTIFGSGNKKKQYKAEDVVENKDSVYSFSRNKWLIIKNLRNRVNVQIDQDTYAITVTASMPDPHAAAGLAQATVQNIEKEVRDYRSRSAKKNLAFIKQQTQTAKQAFEKSQNNLADFRDSNINLTSARAKSKEEQLQSRKTLNFNTYNSLLQQLEQAKIRVQQETPVVAVLQPATVPLDKSSPKRKLIVVVSLILGLIVGLGWSLTQSWGREFVAEITSSKNADHYDHEHSPG